MKDLIKKTDAELNKILRETKVKLRETRFATAGSRAKDVKEIRALKRKIAQILTVLNSRLAE